MGLFGKPSESLIQSFRSALGDVVAVPGHAIKRVEVGWFRYKPQFFQWSVEAGPPESLELPAESSFWFKGHLLRWTPEAKILSADEHFATACETSSHASDIDITTKCQSGIPAADITCEQTDLRVFADPSCQIGLTFREPAACHEPLISGTSLPLFTATTLPASGNVRYKSVELITPVVLDVRAARLQFTLAVLTHILPARFASTVAWFSFGPAPRQSRLSRQVSRNTGNAGDRIQRVTAPEPPPTLKQADLKERLRWILSPPIHEILSDPAFALPYPPRPYQTFGVKWLYDRDNALLADEMGLGKTMQAIVAARVLWREGRIKQVLVVCPKPLISNWCQELDLWWPEIHAYTKAVESDRRWFLRDATQDVVVKIINYESLQREADWLRDEAKPPYHDLVVIDEAQRIKNPDSKSAQAVKALKADRRWALTGTPLENSTDDVASVFGFVSPGLVQVRRTGRRKTQAEEEAAETCHRAVHASASPGGRAGRPAQTTRARRSRRSRTPSTQGV
jgi:hypothetical protein